MSPYKSWIEYGWAGAIKNALLLAALGAVCLAGCASPPHFPTVKQHTTRKAVTASWPNWDQCLRQHGVTVAAGYDPYDPHGVRKPNADPQVIRACQRYEPPAPPPSNAFSQQLAATSKCMAAHGFPNTYKLLPDDGYEINYGPGISPATPGFTAAQKTCGPLA